MLMEYLTRVRVDSRNEGVEVRGGAYGPYVVVHDGYVACVAVRLH